LPDTTIPNPRDASDGPVADRNDPAGGTTAYNQRRYIDNFSGIPEIIIPGASSYNGLNLVTQMGWNTWNAFGCDADEELLLSSARNLVDFGLRDLG
jgi:alpha-galactosidase